MNRMIHWKLLRQMTDDDTRAPADTVINDPQAGEPSKDIMGRIPSILPGAIEAAISWAEENGIDLRNAVTRVADSVSQDLPE